MPRVSFSTVPIIVTNGIGTLLFHFSMKSKSGDAFFVMYCLTVMRYCCTSSLTLISERLETLFSFCKSLILTCAESLNLAFKIACVTFSYRAPLISTGPFQFCNIDSIFHLSLSTLRNTTALHPLEYRKRMHHTSSTADHTDERIAHCLCGSDTTASS